MHNTYGELGSADLANKYGFAPAPGSNPFDAVTLDKAALVGAAAAALGERGLRQRCRLLAQERSVAAAPSARCLLPLLLCRACTVVRVQQHACKPFYWYGRRGMLRGCAGVCISLAACMLT